MVLQHEDASPRPRKVLTWVLAGTIVALTVALAAVGVAIASKGAAPATAETAGTDTPPPEKPFPADEPPASAGGGPCIAVTVLSSFENAELATALAAGYNAVPRDVGGRCVTVTASKEKSGVAASHAAAGFADLGADQRPTVWMPDASSWLSVARNEGADIVPSDHTGAGSSSIVVAMPEHLAEAIGWDEAAPRWTDVFAAAVDDTVWAGLGHPEWGPFKLGKTSPLVATSGEAALLSSFGAAGEGIGTTTSSDLADLAIAAEVRQHELATSHYMATPEHFLWHARDAEAKGSAADFLSAVIVDEKSVWDYNRGIVSRDGVTRVQGDPPKEPLIPIAPSDGSYAADLPAVTLDGDWVDEAERAGSQDFLRFLGTAEGQQIVRDAGYRDLHGDLSDAVRDVGRLPQEQTTVIPFPDQKTIGDVHAAFTDVRKRASVLFLVDVSGSMSAPIPNGESKLDAAKSAIEAALDHFTAGDDVGLAAFSSAGDATLTPGLVTPVGGVSEHRDSLIAAVEGLSPQSYTPLYAAVDEFTKLQASNYDPDKITAVVLLSDGANETAVPTIDETALLSNLADRKRFAPVLVFTLAYGADADVATLQKISSATGAHFYDATDPTKITAVLGDLVTSF